ncbi:MAG: hypothetical protein EOP34_12095, partial [Rickettsiales bacterium]
MLIVKIIIFILYSTSSYAFEVAHNIPYHNRYFVGRNDYLMDIQSKLHDDNIVNINGIGGIGKTQIAKEFAYNNKDKYDIIWWFDAESSIIEQYRKLAISLNKLGYTDIDTNLPSDVFLEDIKDKLNSSNQKILLVLDNLKDEDKLKEFLINFNIENKHIIVTSRIKFIEPSITISLFNSNESISLLSSLIKDKNQEDLEKIAKILGNYPLNLVSFSYY